ncbi:MAG: hypothetical protein JOY61_10260, partial [Chloroflexi bacterium]|nr:hypothetical protein [Chloroflexota bacterium]
MPDSPDDAQSTAIRVGANARLGDITVQGDVAGRDIVKIAEDLTYDVSDLSQNPYLGLASYTYAMRAFYGGREPLIAAAVERLTAAGDEPALVFITGASGSGKSSFAQAGLIPALEQAYAARRCRVRWSVARPGHHPVQALGRALHELGVADPPDGDWLRVLRAPEDLNLLLASRRQGEQVNVLLFDQFEELFTQADPSERDVVTALLSGLGTFSDLRTHVLATLRSDYLSRLFDTPALLERFKRDGIELRAMSSDELARAIRRPLQAQASMDGKEKRIDPALVERLVEDVGEDPSLLPLLQVTLRGLWDEPPHRLVLERYRSLTDALEQQADQVWQRDAQGRERPPAERDQLMSILLDLVEVSLDDDPRRDVRRTLPKYELLQGPPERGPLIEELVAARLLATSVEHGPTRDIEVVDIVHETLLRSWPRLSEQIVARRAGLQQRERFRNALQEWLQHDRSDDYLLAGVRLAEARQLAAADDLSTRGVDARSLLARSIDQQEQVHRRELAQAQALAEEQSHRADVERSARRRQAVFTVAILALAVVAGAVAVIALSLRAQTDAALLQATNEQALARSRALALQSVAQLDTNPDSSLVLATEAALTGATTDAEDALRQALLRSHV